MPNHEPEIPLLTWKDFQGAPWFYSHEYFKRRRLEDFAYLIQAAGGVAAFLVMGGLLGVTLFFSWACPFWALLLVALPVVYVVRPFAMYLAYSHFYPEKGK